MPLRCIICIPDWSEVQHQHRSKLFFVSFFPSSPLFLNTVCLFKGVIFLHTSSSKDALYSMFRNDREIDVRVSEKDREKGKVCVCVCLCINTRLTVALALKFWPLPEGKKKTLLDHRDTCSKPAEAWAKSFHYTTHTSTHTLTVTVYLHCLLPKNTYSRI